MNKQTLILLIIFANISFAQNYGSLHFTNYADDKLSAFSLTFDDGLLTHTENVRPILNDHGLKGTFYVLPPYLTDSLPGIWRYGTWPGFKAMASEGHEIGSHTMHHLDLTTLPWGDLFDDSTLLYEFYQSRIFIEQKVPIEKCISLNYPFTLHNSTVDSAASLFYENARTLGQIPNDSSLSEKEWHALKAKVVLFSSPRNSVYDDYDELENFLLWAVNSIENHKWGMIIIHDVVPFSELQGLIDQGIYEPITNEWLGWLCDFLDARSKRKDVWVETVGNITRYIKERDNSNYQIISSTDQLIEINVTDNLVNTVYNYPLSAYVKIPIDWQFIRTEQNGIVDTLSTLSSDSGRVVLVKVIPDNGILKISPVSATSIDNNINGVIAFKLSQNYPNPFNPNTIIRYSVGSAVFVQLKVFDILGNEIATLVNENQSTGNYEVKFGFASGMPKLASGLYFYRLKAGDYVETRKMILLK